MGWAQNYIKQLQEGKTIQFRPRGHSMSGKIDDGQLVTVAPLVASTELSIGDAVLCTVVGREYLHLIKAIDPGKYLTRVQIGNNKGKINGWTTRSRIYGLVIKVEP